MTPDQILTPAEAVAILNGQSNVTENTGANEATVNDDFIAQDDPDLEIDTDLEPELAIEPDVESVDESDEPDEPAIEAPSTWSADDKAEFAKLDREAQEIMIKHDQRRNKALNEALERAATSRKAAEAEAQTIARQRSELDQLLPTIREKYARWADVTPQQWAAAFQHDPIQAAAAKAQYEAEKAEVEQLEKARNEIQQQEIAKYRQGEHETFIEIAKSDPVAKRLLAEAKTALPEVATYLKKEGFGDDRTQYISAKELLIVRKAQLYDKLVAEREAKKSEAPHTKQTSASPARMRAPTTTGKSQQKSQIDTQARRLAQTRSVADAVALLNMRDAEVRKGR